MKYYALAFIWTLVVAALSLAAPGGPLAPRAPLAMQACGVKCGVERVSVKTLTDADSGAVVRWKAVPTTVTELRAIPAPTRAELPEDGRVAPTETTMWDVHAALLGWKLEVGDSDLHLVIAEPTNHRRTMIAEVPNIHCARMCASPVAAEVAEARAAIVAKLGHPSHAYRKLTPPVAVEIVGVGFFDFIHGQLGVAPNGIELHPALSIGFP